MSEIEEIIATTGRKWCNWNLGVEPGDTMAPALAAAVVAALDAAGLVIVPKVAATAESIGTRYRIDHDGFVGTVIGGYRRLDGKTGKVLQLDGTNIVHVYGDKWLINLVAPK